MASMEYVGLGVAIGLLIVGIATPMQRSGSTIAGSIAQHIEQVVSNAPRTAATGRVRTWHDRRVERGNAPARVPAGDLRLSPLVRPRAVWNAQGQTSARPAGAQVTASARACVLCAALDASYGVSRGATYDTDGHRIGVGLDATAAAHVSVVAAEATAHARRTIGPATVSGRGRVRAGIGAEAEGRASVHLAAREQDVQLEGNAAAGATAHAEAKVGATMLGIAVEQSGRVDGWAGAGARGVIGLRRSDGRVEWRLGGGAALGLGGAAEWSGSIDATNIPRPVRRFAVSSLRLSLRAAGMPLP